jgi:hypothetical protein
MSESEQASIESEIFTNKLGVAFEIGLRKRPGI